MRTGTATIVKLIQPPGLVQLLTSAVASHLFVGNILGLSPAYSSLAALTGGGTLVDGAGSSVPAVAARKVRAVSYRTYARPARDDAQGALDAGMQLHYDFKVVQGDGFNFHADVRVFLKQKLEKVSRFVYMEMQLLDPTLKACIYPPV